MDIQEHSQEGNAKFNFLGVILESKRSWRAHFQAFREPEIHILETMVPALAYIGLSTNLPEVGTYAKQKLKT